MQFEVEYVIIRVPKGTSFAVAAKQLAFAALEFGRARMLFNDTWYETSENTLTDTVHHVIKKKTEVPSDDSLA